MSKEAFEAACKAHGWPLGIRTDGSYVGSTEVRWGAWQAAESHTARECVEWHERQAEVAGRADNTEEARLHMAHAKHFRAAYPDAFKEGE